MILPYQIETYLDKIAKTISGRPAHFELVTKDQLYILKQGDLILSANGFIKDNLKYDLEVGSFYTLLGGGDIPQCFIQQKGILNFEKGEIAAYHPSTLNNKQAQFVRKDFVEPQYRSLEEFYRFIEIIQQKAMLKMVYD